MTSCHMTQQMRAQHTVQITLTWLFQACRAHSAYNSCDMDHPQPSSSVGKYYTTTDAGDCSHEPGSCSTSRAGPRRSGGYIPNPAKSVRVSNSLIKRGELGGAPPSCDIPQTSLFSLGSRDIAIFLTPTPFTWKTPTPPEDIRPLKFVFELLFHALLLSAAPEKSHL